MEKLELKHLAPYLPYGLKYCRVHQSPIDLTEKIEFVGEVSTKGDVHNINNNLLCEYLNMKYLPILIPLTEKENENYFFHFSNDEGFMLKRRNETYTRLNELEYFFENHFDVFGLIENGLAIDINTLEL